MKATATQLFLLFALNANAQKLSQTSKDSNAYKELARVSKLNRSSDGFARQNNDKEYVEIFTKYSNENNVHAINMLAQTYQYGRKGVDVNKEKAVELYTKAGKLGYSNSWFHLGQMFRATHREKQNYTKALQYYLQGDKLNNTLCTYNVAYMFYKGLGCTQNYQQAVAYFTKGSISNNRDCMYFLGLCYKNGEGVTKNIDSAINWLSIAAKKGIVLAQAEIDNFITEISPNNFLQEQTFKKVELSTHKTIETGKYNGVLNTYDWSGKKMLKQLPFEITIQEIKNSIQGILKIEGDTNIYTSKKLSTTNQFIFEKLKTPIILEQLVFTTNNNGNTIEGNIVSYTRYNYNETYNPQYFIASKEVVNTDLVVNKKGDEYLIYPNPFTNSVIINLKVQKPTNVIATISNVAGSVVYSKTFVVNSKSVQSIQITTTSLTPGIYYLSLQYHSFIKTTKIIKLINNGL